MHQFFEMQDKSIKEAPRFYNKVDIQLKTI